MKISTDILHALSWHTGDDAAGDEEAAGGSSEEIRGIPAVKGLSTSPTASQEGDKKGDKAAPEGGEDVDKPQLPKDGDKPQGLWG